MLHCTVQCNRTKWIVVQSVSIMRAMGRSREQKGGFFSGLGAFSLERLLNRWKYTSLCSAQNSCGSCTEQLQSCPVLCKASQAKYRTDNHHNIRAAQNVELLHSRQYDHRSAVGALPWGEWEDWAHQGKEGVGLVWDMRSWRQTDIYKTTILSCQFLGFGVRAPPDRINS